MCGSDFANNALSLEDAQKVQMRSDFSLIKVPEARRYIYAISTLDVCYLTKKYAAL